MSQTYIRIAKTPDVERVLADLRARFSLLNEAEIIRLALSEVHNKEMEDKMTRIVRQLRGGQITIPADYRRLLGITDDSLLQMSAEAGELRIKPVRVTDQAGSDWIKDLYDLFAPVRSQATKHSEEEVDTAIDEAVQAVRKAHG